MTATGVRPTDELERSIGRLRLHDHVCVIYDTQEEQLRSMVPFVRLGIEGGDRCFYVADSAMVEAVVAAMRRGGVDVDGAVRAGKLTVATQRQAYLAGGRFDPDAMLDLASGAALQAVADGFSGLRIAGEMNWALGGDPGCERLLEYEVKVNRRIPREPALAVCQYDRSRFSPDLIGDIIRTHPLVVVGGRVCRNFYYVPPEELLGPDRTRREVDRLLENILERERAEDALRESERRLSMVLEASQHAFWDWDLESGVLTFSPLWARWLGHAPAERRGTVEEWKDAVHPDDLPGLWAAVEANLRGESELHRSEYCLRGGTGEPRWISSRGRVVARDRAGRPLRMAGTSADVTERHSLQTRLEMAGRLASVGTLAAGVAHEINNPLAFVSANLAFLAEELAEDPARLAEGAGEQREAAAEAIDGAERVRDIVKGLRRFAVPGREERRGPVDVRAEIEAAVGITRAQVAARARLRVDVPVDLPAVVAGQHQIGQVLVNLLVNAAQAIPEGRSAENLVRVGASAGDGQVVIEVADTGTGISSQLLPRIFDPFFTTKETGVGSGLGLAICHGIVAGAGGRIEVASELGQGTTFRVVLPAAGPAREGAPPPAPAPAHRRVLVVDDEPLVARAIGRILAKEHEVDIATSGETAAARLEAGERWDVVLCDLLMPGMTGMDLAARLARTSPDVVPRLVFMTGGAFTERSRAFLATGQHRHLEKPVDAAALRRVVQEVASGS